ncbi:MAG TPA: 5-formyltetrahydrofolate cyclo-ligase [Polyangiaceae bacterium]|jgi:5-formyltetrahydrofolate cyclo-ligase
MIHDAEIVLRAKAELRKRLRGLRNTHPAGALAKRSERIVDTLEKLDALTTAKTVALFWPIEARHEIDLRELDVRLRARGVGIAYPSIEESGEMTFRVATIEALTEHPLGFRGAPQSAPEPEVLDAIVIPAIALDGSGRRLGYGAGFYDRALPRFAPAKKIGVAYDFQLLVEVPVSPNDVAMDFVVTDARVIAI